MRSITFVALGSLALLATLIAFLWEGNSTSDAGTRLTFYCAAGIKPPVERIARDYEKRYGVLIDLSYGGSGTLLSGIDVTKRGDLYLAADDSYLDLARERGLVAERFDIARMRPVIGVARGNPKKIAGRRDLLREDVRLGLANPEAAAIGRTTRALLRSDGLWTQVKTRTQVFKPTVNDLANDLVIGAVDAAVLWDAVANQYPGIEIVRDELFESSPRLISLGILATSKSPTASLRFARFLASRDEGKPHFERCGYEAVAGDVWEEVPELVLMHGAMLSKAIEDTVADFEAREGVRVTRIPNGCGILVAQMRAGAHPDAYFSCDESFLDMVEDRFEPGLTVSGNRMVILVAKGNPKNIRTTADLAGSGLRVGLAHAEKSALGALAQRMLERQGHWQPLMDSQNVKVFSPTGDFLVNQTRTGSLDATIVYKSNTAMVREHLDVVEIDDPDAFAQQPYAVASDTKHKNTMRRLLDAILTTESRRRFEGLGFRWRIPERR